VVNIILEEKETALSINCIGWMGYRVNVDQWQRMKCVPLLENEPPLST
jgi:hypothetical protein